MDQPPEDSPRGSTHERRNAIICRVLVFSANRLVAYCPSRWVRGVRGCPQHVRTTQIFRLGLYQRTHLTGTGHLSPTSIHDDPHNGHCHYYDSLADVYLDCASHDLDDSLSSQYSHAGRDIDSAWRGHDCSRCTGRLRKHGIRNGIFNPHSNPSAEHLYGFNDLCVHDHYIRSSNNSDEHSNYGYHLHHFHRRPGDNPNKLGHHDRRIPNHCNRSWDNSN